MAKSKPFHVAPYSSFRYGVADMLPDTTVSVKETLTAYCKRKFITKTQAKYLIRNRWLLATRSGKHIYVAEACPNEIEAHLMG